MIEINLDEFGVEGNFEIEYGEGTLAAGAVNEFAKGLKGTVAGGLY